MVASLSNSIWRELHIRARAGVYPPPSLLATLELLQTPELLFEFHTPYGEKTVDLRAEYSPFTFARSLIC